ncbi:MAG: isochorismate synthase [Leucobacter sp.]
MINSAPAPRLFAVSRPLAELPGPAELVAHADPHDPLLWLRGDRGCVGVGEVLRLTFAGEDRFAEVARGWRALTERAVVDDPIELPGSGLIAFAALAFADGSRALSTLIVPRFVISRHGEAAWVTEIRAEPISTEPVLPAPPEPGAWNGVELPIETPDPDYLRGVAEATERIDRKEIEKVVLARPVRGWIGSGDDLRTPLARLASRYEDCWTFAVDGLVGASPETLIRRTEGIVSARVLAGTRGRKADPAADARARDELFSSPKEQHEHAFAVQSVVTALGPHVHELQCNEQPFALKLPNVWHLATDVRAVPSRSASSLELAEALHPTAAVAGTPTRAAIEAIAELEPFDRERYAGAVGWIDADGDGEWVIALRCAQLGDDEDGQRSVTAYAGGGILADSDPQREFGETVSKLRPIAEAFSA